VTTPLAPGPVDPAQVFAQVRANIAFEHMVMAMLIAAAVSGGALLVLNAVFLIAKGAASAAGFLSIAVDAVYFAFLTFLIGFLASVVIGLPLFLVLEKAKLRKAWPYLIATLVVQYAAYSIGRGQFLTFDDMALPAGAVLFLPGLVAALLFGARMRPVWLAAERAEKTPALYEAH
jgi:hypothetical protein